MAATTEVAKVVGTAAEVVVVSTALMVVVGVSEVEVVEVASAVVDVDITDTQDELAQVTAAPASAALQAALAQSAIPYRKLTFEHRHSDVTGTQPVVVCMLLMQVCYSSC